jgi:hypothetical protein
MNLFAEFIIRIFKFIQMIIVRKPMAVAARSQAGACGHSLAGIAGSNLAGGINVYLLWVLCVVR